ncbi:YT521-B-like domain-containing protein [Calycina marina]|uniref:YT521-B-like domain-containing protein n=1 Tax=Calycina marina TaxID=1763456 RepID=A0A9P8CEX3_9HELO|nr:YT521-B-like domain-containing protein [Calycina marina]
MQQGHSQAHPLAQQFSSGQNAPTKTEPFEMNHLGNSLPEFLSHPNYAMQPQSQQSRFPSSYSPTGHGFHPQTSFSNVQGRNSPGHIAYGHPYQAQYQASYAPSHTPSPPHQQGGISPANQFYQNQMYFAQQQHLNSQQVPPQYFIQSGQYQLHNQVFPAMSSMGLPGARNHGMQADNRHQPHQQQFGYMGVESGSARAKTSTIKPCARQSSVVRGPPRKPRQSGHAIWIGNLPPQTELMHLVHHVCKEAAGLQSLFLISKSNCAFANFKDETSCAEAQGKIHESRFQTVRLVSRLRSNSTSVGPSATGSVIPTGPTALASPASPSAAQNSLQDPEQVLGITKVVEPEIEEGVPLKDTTLPNDKFFIVKSLTVEDLELSVRNGVWATQSHNEEALNKAYKSADNVYLIFSTNKSGEYFGYGRMISPIDDDPAAAIAFAPKAQAMEDPELPKAIPTAATEFSPKGRIIDDSARGTIFWEAERDEEDEANESDSIKSEEGPAESKVWGKPFKIEWLSTTRLPFYRTRGLRNPWNQNREVKIARDGTELETSIGRRLIALFHRVPSPDIQPVPQLPPLPMAVFPPQQPFN